MSEETPGSSLQLDLLAWFEMNKKAVIGGLGLIVVAVAGVIIWKGSRAAAIENASDALLVAQITRTDKNAVGADKLDAIANAHAGTPTAAQAGLLAAKELFVAGKYVEARNHFERVADSGGADLQVVAQLGVAACFDAENNLPEALKAYEVVITLPANEAVLAQARLAKARVFEALNQPKEALALYNEVAKSGGSTLASDATIRRAQLLQKHPEFDLPASVTNTVNVLPAPAK
jgi:predicted negative regulator of RcsB-dependent stress response